MVEELNIILNKELEEIAKERRDANTQIGLLLKRNQAHKHYKELCMMFILILRLLGILMFELRVLANI